MLKVITLALLIGLIFSLIIASILIPLLHKIGANQRLSEYLSDKHKSKQYTPTMGGLIFIIPPIITMIILLLTKRINYSFNLKANIV